MERSLLLHHPQQHEINNSHVATSPASYPSDSTHNEGSAPAQQPPVTPKPVFRSDDTNPYPTTFVQANTTNFKQVVQMLTGSTTPTEQSHHQQQQQRPDPIPSSRAAAAIPPIRTTQKKQQAFGLYKRRNSLKNALMINTLLPGFSSSSSSPSEAALTPPGPGFSPRNLFPRPHQHHNEALSPSVLDFPKLTLSSPVTPLNDDPFGKSSPLLGNSSSSSSEEDRAIAEKGFYFHRSQANTPRDSEPQLLPLFPVTSPKISGTPS